MFGQTHTLEETMRNVYEQAAEANTSTMNIYGKKLSKVTAASLYSAPPPRIEFNDDGSIRTSESANDDIIMSTEGADVGFKAAIRAQQEANAPTNTTTSSNHLIVQDFRALPPSAAPISFAAGTGGTDWMALNKTEKPKPIVAAGTIIAASPSPDMLKANPIDEVKIEKNKRII
jgi:hypothetical protein